MRLFKLLVFVAIVGGLTLVVVHDPGSARFVWRSTVVETTAALALAAALAGGCVFVLLDRLVRFVLQGPALWKARRRSRRLEGAHADEEKALAALALGDAVHAGHAALAARRIWGSTPLVTWLQARAADMAGDQRVAQEECRRLVQTSGAGPLLGHYGLAAHALRRGDDSEAEREVESLARLKPDAPWVALARLELFTRRCRWADALRVLPLVTAGHLLPPNKARAIQVMLILAEAQEFHRQDAREPALAGAEQALRLLPTFLPAALTLAQTQRASGYERAARRTALRAWNHRPHPNLIVFLDDPAERREDGALGTYRRLEKLMRETAEDPVCRLALAEAALHADLWGEARRLLTGLTERPRVTRHVYRLLADLERRESRNDRAAAVWLERAATAWPEPRWLCTTCGQGHPTWQATCPTCGTLGSLAWGIPGEARSTQGANTEERGLLHVASPWLAPEALVGGSV